MPATTRSTRARRSACVVSSRRAAIEPSTYCGLRRWYARTRLALLLAGPSTIVTYTPPVPLPAVDVVQVWHDRHTVDPAHSWLRGGIRRAASLHDR